MRIAEDGEDLVGAVCVCSTGRVAVVTGKTTFKTDSGEVVTCWAGLGLDGKGTWASKTPCVLAESGQEFHDKLKDRFGGKMSYLG